MSKYDFYVKKEKYLLHNHRGCCLNVLKNHIYLAASLRRRNSREPYFIVTSAVFSHVELLCMCVCVCLRMELHLFGLLGHIHHVARVCP